MTEIQAPYEATAEKPEGGPVSASQAAPGRRAESNAQPRRLGMRAALNRARTLREGKDLPPEKEAVLALTARLLVHFENASNRLYHDGELTQEGEVRVLLSRTLPDLFDRVSEGLRYAFSADGDKGQW